jgi:hypothetical protein
MWLPVPPGSVPYMASDPSGNSQTGVYLALTTNFVEEYPWNGDTTYYFNGPKDNGTTPPQVCAVSGIITQPSDLRQRGDGRYTYKGFYFGPFKPPR